MVRASHLQPISRRFESRPLRFTNDPGQVVHTRVPQFTKQYKLVLANGRVVFYGWEGIIGLACVALSMAWEWEREMSTLSKLYLEYYGIFAFT